MRLAGWVFIVVVGIAGILLASTFWSASTESQVPSTPTPTIVPTAKPVTKPVITGRPTVRPVVTITSHPTVAPTKAPTPVVTPTTSVSISAITKYMHHVSGTSHGTVLLIGYQSTLMSQIRTAIEMRKADYWWATIDSVPTADARYITSAVGAVCPNVRTLFANPILIINGKCGEAKDSQQALHAMGLV